MPTNVNRRTVDLSQYPGLVVVYLGMRVNRMAGLKTLAGFGPQISDSVAAQPVGLLLHENFVFSLSPRMSVCVSIGGTWSRFSRGRALSRIDSGGRIFCETPAARASGMRPT